MEGSGSPRAVAVASPTARPDQPSVAPPPQTQAAPPVRQLRVLVAKPGLDGHDRGAKIIARALRDAGMEVIYTGIRQTPQMIVEAAIQEDVDAILLSILSGAHMAIFPKIMDLLRAEGVDDVLVMAGGILPDEDIPAIEAMGIKGNFGPGTNTQDIVAVIRANVPPARINRPLPPRGDASVPPDAHAPAEGA